MITIKSIARPGGYEDKEENNMYNLTLREFLEDYKGFDYSNGEIVIVNQRTAKTYICRCENFLIKSTHFHDFTNEYDMPVYHYEHTEKTMVIIL